MRYSASMSYDVNKNHRIWIVVYNFYTINHWTSAFSTNNNHYCDYYLGVLSCLTQLKVLISETKWYGTSFVPTVMATNEIYAVVVWYNLWFADHNLEYVQFNGSIFSSKYREYLWVVTHRRLLPIYTYHGVNIAVWLKLSKLITHGQTCYHTVADIWMISAQLIWCILVALQKICMITRWYWKLIPAVTNRTHFIDDTFVTSIYHKIYDFNFEVINYHFPQSNIYSRLGYTTDTLS